MKENIPNFLGKMVIRSQDPDLIIAALRYSWRTLFLGSELRYKPKKSDFGIFIEFKILEIII